MSYDTLSPVVPPWDEIIHAADEGVPIAALKRIFRCDTGELRAHLHAAVAAGRLTDMPVEDWPPLVPRDQRVPSVPHHTIGEDDSDVLMRMARHFKTSRLESRIFLVILRRGYALRETLHDVVEDNRGNPQDATQEKIIDVVIHKLRKKLKLYDITLHTVHSRGYDMSEAERQKAWLIIRGDQS